MADVDSKILKQVEFYFSNSNLPRDKFLRAETEKNEGWVAIEVIASFKKMQELTKDPGVVAEALRKSESLLEVNEDGTQVRRTEPIPADINLDPQSLYMKGFPQDYTMEQLQEFMAKHIEGSEKVNCIRMRRLRDKTFKGSIFVEFDSPATAERVKSLELKAPTEAADALVVEMKADYDAKKKAERAEWLAKKKAGNNDKKRAREGEEGEGEKQEFKKDITLDCIVKVSGLSEGIQREDIKGAFETAGAKVQFVEFNRGNVTGYVRLHPETELKATAVVEKMAEAKTEIGSVVPELVVLQGDEEQAYWVKVFEAQQNAKSGKRKGRGGFKKQRN